MRNIKKLIALTLSITMFGAVFAGCGDDSKDSENDIPKVADLEAQAKPTGNILNFTAPEKGEDIIVMTIKGYGDVKIKLFPDQSPLGAANFKALAKKNYYDGLTFHRIINEFMIQGGDPLGNGTGGESIWGGKFDGGVSEDLCHVTGAVAYANSGSTATNGSQFYIVTGLSAESLDDKYFDNLEQQSLEMYQYGMSDSVKTWNDNARKIYSEYGGYPFLDGGYTVFGQVFDGLDIVMDIQGVETNESDKPLESVVIEKMTVEKYDGGDVKFKVSDYK